MIENLQILTASAIANDSGVFVPVNNIAGLSGGEISETGATLEGKITYGILNGLFAALSVVNPLGFAQFDKSSPAGTGDNLYTEGIEVSFQRLIDLRTGAIALPLLPNKGSAMGTGKLLLTDVWEDCVLIASGASSGGAGLIIPHEWIESYGGEIPATLAGDAREWWGALLMAMADTLTLRTATVSSAITFKQNLNTNRVTGVSIPTEWYDEANPLANLSAADLPFVRLTQERIRIDYELLTNPLAQTFEVAIKTA